jgi:hypothetical protein
MTCATVIWWQQLKIQSGLTLCIFELCEFEILRCKKILIKSRLVRRVWSNANPLPPKNLEESRTFFRSCLVLCEVFGKASSHKMRPHYTAGCHRFQYILPLYCWMPPLPIHPAIILLDATASNTSCHYTARCHRFQYILPLYCWMPPQTAGPSFREVRSRNAMVFTAYSS